MRTTRHPLTIRMMLLTAAFMCLQFEVTANLLRAQSVSDTQPKPNPQADLPLSERQSSVAERFKRLEALLLRSSELQSVDNPTRAALLQQAAKLGKQKQLADLLAMAADHLEKKQITEAIEQQKISRDSLQMLLELLQSENRGKRVREERDEVRRWIEETNRLLRMQGSLRGRTEGGQAAKQAAQDQDRLSEKAKDIAAQLGPDDKDEDASDTESDDSKNSEKNGAKEASDSDAGEGDESDSDSKAAESEDESNGSDSSQENSSEGQQSEGSEGQQSEGQQSEGQQSEGQQSEGQQSEGQQSEGQQSEGQQSEGQQSEPQSPQQRAKQRIQQAQKKMEEAKDALDQSEDDPEKREKAIQKQREAEQNLREAIEELEQILRQLREEEIERSLSSLEDRFRRMLDMQNRVLDESQRLLENAGTDSGNRQVEIKANSLSKEENKILSEGERAFLLLREEGSSAAFPEAVQQLNVDIANVVKRLSDGKVDELTISIESEIVSSLEEMIQALVEVQKENEKKRQQRQQQQGQGQQMQQGEQPLVDQLAELRLILTLQKRINKRTNAMSKMLEDPKDAVGQAEDGDIIQILQDLSKRQFKIGNVTRNLLQEDE